MLKGIEIGQIWENDGSRIEIMDINSVPFGASISVRDADDEDSTWFVIGMQTLLMHFTLEGDSCEEEIQNGAICIDCQDFFPHAPAQDGFKCWACRNGW